MESTVSSLVGTADTQKKFPCIFAAYGCECRFKEKWRLNAHINPPRCAGARGNPEAPGKLAAYLENEKNAEAKNKDETASHPSRNSTVCGCGVLLRKKNLSDHKKSAGHLAWEARGKLAIIFARYHAVLSQQYKYRMLNAFCMGFVKSMLSRAAAALDDLTSLILLKRAQVISGIMARIESRKIPHGEPAPVPVPTPAPVQVAVPVQAHAPGPVAAPSAVPPQPTEDCVFLGEAPRKGKRVPQTSDSIARSIVQSALRRKTKAKDHLATSLGLDRELPPQFPTKVHVPASRGLSLVQPEVWSPPVFGTTHVPGPNQFFCPFRDSPWPRTLLPRKLWTYDYVRARQYCALESHPDVFRREINEVMREIVDTVVEWQGHEYSAKEEYYRRLFEQFEEDFDRSLRRPDRIEFTPDEERKMDKTPGDISMEYEERREAHNFAQRLHIMRRDANRNYQEMKRLEEAGMLPRETKKKKVDDS